MALKDYYDLEARRSAIALLEQEIIEKEAQNLIVPERLTSPHELIVSARKSLSAKLSQPFRGPKLARTSTDELNICVTPDNVSSALRFMDTFIKVVLNRGHKVLNERNLTYVVISQEKIEVNFREKLKRVPIVTNSSWQEYGYVATGILTFNAKIKYNTTVLAIIAG